MSLEWDAQKEATNFVKHNVSLAIAERFDWDNARWEEDRTHDEERYVAYGLATDGFGYAIVFTFRGATIRVISAVALPRESTGSMSTKSADLDLPVDDDVPELTPARAKALRPMSELFTKKGIRPLGRPKSDSRKVPVTIRLDAEVVEYFKRDGDRWQTRINELLSSAVREAKAAGAPPVGRKQANRKSA